RVDHGERNLAVQRIGFRHAGLNHLEARLFGQAMGRNEIGHVVLFSSRGADTLTTRSAVSYYARRGARMDKIKLYSPIQVGVAGFCGGPLATVHTLWANFRALDNPSGARHTLIWGSMIVLAVIGVLPFLPDKFPNLAIPLATLFVGQLIVRKSQMTKQ